MITTEQKRLVQESFETFGPVLEKVASQFYERLFTLAPSTKPLFHISVQEQERKFIDMLSVAVYGLDHVDHLSAALHLLGKRHVDYGVMPSNYKLVKEALFWTFEKNFRTLFSGETYTAWNNFYDFLEEEMLSGSQHYQKPATGKSL